MTEKIEIPISAKKVYLLVIGSLLFTVLGIWLFINAESLQGHSMKFSRNPVFLKIVGIASVVFFGAAGIFSIKKLSDNKPGLTIDDIGITDNSSGSSIGLINWADIRSIRTEQIMSTKFLIIDIDNAEKYVALAKNKLKAKLLKANIKMYGTPVAISSTTLNFKFTELEKLLRMEFEKNKKEHNNG
jgi:hypothetical protein